MLCTSCLSMERLARDPLAVRFGVHRPCNCLKRGNSKGGAAYFCNVYLLSSQQKYCILRQTAAALLDLCLQVGGICVVRQRG